MSRPIMRAHVSEGDAGAKCLIRLRRRGSDRSEVGRSVPRADTLWPPAHERFVFVRVAILARRESVRGDVMQLGGLVITERLAHGREVVVQRRGARILPQCFLPDLARIAELSDVDARIPFVKRWRIRIELDRLAHAPRRDAVGRIHRGISRRLIERDVFLLIRQLLAARGRPLAFFESHVNDFTERYASAFGSPPRRASRMRSCPPRLTCSMKRSTNASTLTVSPIARTRAIVSTSPRSCGAGTRRSNVMRGAAARNGPARMNSNPPIRGAEAHGRIGS